MHRELCKHLTPPILIVAAGSECNTLHLLVLPPRLIRPFPRPSPTPPPLQTATDNPPPPTESTMMFATLTLPDRGSVATTMFVRLCFQPPRPRPPQRQGRATINAKTFTLYQAKFTKSRLEMVAYIALVQTHLTDTQTDRHRHMTVKVSLPIESVC